MEERDVPGQILLGSMDWTGITAFFSLSVFSWKCGVKLDMALVTNDISLAKLELLSIQQQAQFTSI
jgi:hypothetical protein